MIGVTRNIKEGDEIRRFNVETLAGDRIDVPDPTGLTHLQFRRFAGCPACNLHLRSFARRRDELRVAGVTEVIFFHSTAQAMRPFQGGLPFAVIPDPERRFYRQFGVEQSVRAVLSIKALASFFWGAVALPFLPQPPTDGETKLGLPADFLLSAAGRVHALKYGSHAYEQWSVDELLAMTRKFAR